MNYPHGSECESKSLDISAALQMTFFSPLTKYTFYLLSYKSNLFNFQFFVRLDFLSQEKLCR